MPDWLIWVIVALVVLAIVAAVVMAAGKKKKERNRLEADRLREEAAARGPELQKREAAARETEAEAAAARAEAERRQAQADRLEAEAADRHRAVGDVRDEHHGRLQKADELDPDVDTRSKEYSGPDTAATINARADHRNGRQESHQAGHHDDHDDAPVVEGSAPHRDTTPDRLETHQGDDSGDHLRDSQHDDRPNGANPDQSGGAHRIV